MVYEWLRRFRTDKWAGARGYWEEVPAGTREALAAGAGFLDDKHPEHKAAAMDVMEKRDS